MHKDVPRNLVSRKLAEISLAPQPWAGYQVNLLVHQMILPTHKTKIVATIGPASMAPDVLEAMIRSGMNIARLNFSHGNFQQHAEVISRIRAASAACNQRITIMADLPGPKIRLGIIEPGPIEVAAGDALILTSDDIVGTKDRMSVSFQALPRVVKIGDRLFLNDGIVQLIVVRVEGQDVHCEVAVGGSLSSRKGLNLPRIPLGLSAFTEHDGACLEFALAHGVDAISQSFVESAADVQAVRAAATAAGYAPFIIAKIERVEALDRFDEILAASDGIMIARGDLGVELPIELMAVTQKKLIARANAIGTPVITATQMLESMTTSRLPTRAEATDVANAILDGTDCVMLSAESAMGKFPVEAVAMLAKIAAATESYKATLPRDFDLKSRPREPSASHFLDHAIAGTPCDAVVVPTRSGRTARAVARWRLPVWIVAVSSNPTTLQALAFSFGVLPIERSAEPDSWRDFVRELLTEIPLEARQILLVAGPSARNPDANQRVEFLSL